MKHPSRRPLAKQSLLPCLLHHLELILSPHKLQNDPFTATFRLSTTSCLLGCDLKHTPSLRDRLRGNGVPFHLSTTTNLSHVADKQRITTEGTSSRVGGLQKGITPQSLHTPSRFTKPLLRDQPYPRAGTLRHPPRPGRGPHEERRGEGSNRITPSPPPLCRPPPSHMGGVGETSDWTLGMCWDLRGCWLSNYKGRNSPTSVSHEAWGAPDLVTTPLFDYTKPNPRIFPLTMPNLPGSTRGLPRTVQFPTGPPITPSCPTTPHSGAWDHKPTNWVSTRGPLITDPLPGAYVHPPHPLPFSTPEGLVTAEGQHTRGHSTPNSPWTPTMGHLNQPTPHSTPTRVRVPSSGARANTPNPNPNPCLSHGLGRPTPELTPTHGQPTQANLNWDTGPPNNGYRATRRSQG